MERVSTYQKIRDQLAVEAFAWLKRDKEGAEANTKLQELLIHISKRLFDKQLSITSACKVYGITQSTFRAALGQNPKYYLDSLRIHVGKRLVAETNYNLDDIAELTGYASGNSFRKAFRRATAESVTDYRRHWKRANENPKTQLSADILVLLERLTHAEVKAVRRHLQVLHPEFEDEAPELDFSPTDQPHVPPRFMVNVSRLEVLCAKRVWFEIQGLSEAEQLVERFSNDYAFSLLILSSLP